MYLLIILGILSVLYGVFVQQVGSGTWFWVVWEMLGVCFFIWALLVRCGFFVVHKRIGMLFHLMVLAVILMLGIFCIMMASKFSAKNKKNLDYIIVLGAQVRDTGVSKVLKYRLDAAKEYLDENPDTICIVSGGQGANEPCTEAEAMADYLVAHGIEKDRILLEDKSTNTEENIRYSRKLMREENDGVGIVTNNFHVFRSVQISKNQGLKDVYGIAADSNIWYLPHNMLRECGSILKYYVRMIQGLI